MASASELSGRLSLLIGLLALSLSAAYAHVSGGFTIGARLDEMLEVPELLIGSVFLTLLFQFGTPFLCAAAFFFGAGASRLWSARAGMAAAVLSLVAYVAHVRACYDAIAVP